MTTDILFTDFERIYPTENDVAFSDYNGVNSTEVNFAKNLNYRNPKNAVLAELDGNSNPDNVAGFLITAGAGLDVVITRGRAYIEGRYVELISTTPSYAVGGLPATQDTYIYLELNIAGVVQTSPPARFLTVSVAIDAPHDRPQNAVILGKVRTDATVVTFIEDLRPSQISNSIFLPEVAMTDGASEVIANVDVGDIKFTKTLCGYFFINPRAFSGDSTSVTVRATGDSAFVENTAIIPFDPTSGSNLVRGFVNIPKSLALAPFGKIANFYQISATITATGFAPTTINPLSTSWRLKEWNAKG